MIQYKYGIHMSLYLRNKLLFTTKLVVFSSVENTVFHTIFPLINARVLFVDAYWRGRSKKRRLYIC